MQPSQKESPRGADSPNGHPSSPNLENEKPKGKTEKNQRDKIQKNRPWENRTQKRSSERKSKRERSPKSTIPTPFAFSHSGSSSVARWLSSVYVRIQQL
jgi:hypothetical protein